MAWFAYISSVRYVEHFFVNRAGELVEDIEFEWFGDPEFAFASAEEAQRVGQAARPRGYCVQVFSKEIEA